MKKTMLITGHRGLLGSACVRHFEKEYEILTMDRQFDLRDRDLVVKWFKFFSPNVVVNCAAKVGGVKANKEQPIAFLLDNLKIQNNIIELSAENDVETLVHLGTSCMFPRDAALPVSEDTLLTGRFDDSVEAYAIAKLCGWRLCKAYFEEQGRRFLTVNPSNIYGPNDNYGENAHVVPALIRRAYEAMLIEKELEVWGDGSAIREFIYVDDVAKAIDCIIKGWNSPEVINVGTGVGTSIKTLALTIANAFALTKGIPLNIKWLTDMPTGIPRKTFDVTKLKSLGWEAEVDLGAGLGLAVKDFVENPARGLPPSIF